MFMLQSKFRRRCAGQLEMRAQFPLQSSSPGSSSPVVPDDYFRWYKARSANRVYSDAYTTPAVNDDPIYVIDDEYDPGSPNGAVQAALANRPLWKASVQNGLHMARFDGSNDVLVGLVDGTLLSDLAVGLVFKTHASAPHPGNAYFSWADVLTSSNPFVLVKDDGAGNQIDVYVDSGYRFNNIPYTPAQAICLVLSFEATGGGSPLNGKWNLLVNGVAQTEYTGTIGAFLPFANNAYLMNGFGGYQNGDFGEAIFIGNPSAGVSATAAALSSYLLYTWGI